MKDLLRLLPEGFNIREVAAVRLGVVRNTVVRPLLKMAVVPASRCSNFVSQNCQNFHHATPCTHYQEGYIRLKRKCGNERCTMVPQRGFVVDVHGARLCLVLPVCELQHTDGVPATNPRWTHTSNQINCRPRTVRCPCMHFTSRLN